MNDLEKTEGHKPPEPGPEPTRPPQKPKDAGRNQQQQNYTVLDRELIKAAQSKALVDFWTGNPFDEGGMLAADFTARIESVDRFALKLIPMTENLAPFWLSKSFIAAYSVRVER